MNYPTTPHIKRALSTRKREFDIRFVEHPYTANTASYWDGGSRTTYTVLNLTTGEYSYPPAGSWPNFKAEYTLPPGHVLIESGIFNGKPSTVRITAYNNDRQLIYSWLKLS